MPPILDLQGVHKRYGNTVALAGVDFSCHPGQIHALLGENGAGKTTLLKIAFGLEQPDRGRLQVLGRARSRFGPVQARRCGLGMVHQHFTSVPAFTVAENVALAAGWSVRSPRALTRRVARLTAELGLKLDPTTRADQLPVSLRQRLEIVKALATDTRLLLLDEPTAVLAPPEVASLVAFLRRFAEAGGSVAIITHKLREALAAADWITVIRRGSVVRSGPAGETWESELATAMLGGARSEFSVTPRTTLLTTDQPAAATPAIRRDDPVVRVTGARVRPDGPGPGLTKGDLLAYPGEVVGVAAVEGNGQRELLRALVGLLPVVEGELAVAGTVGFIPEDRTTEGVIEEFNLTENIVLSPDHHAPWLGRIGPWKTIDWGRAEVAASHCVSENHIRAEGLEQPLAALSGGNQQKLVVGRTLMSMPHLIVAENPARGLDLAAARTVMRRLKEAALNGSTVIIYSSDLDEVVDVSDRVVVVRDGQVFEPESGSDRDEIGRMMLGALGPAA